LNDFIKLRKFFFKEKANYDPTPFIAFYIDFLNKDLAEKEKVIVPNLINSIKTHIEIKQFNLMDENDLINIIENMGGNIYLDSDICDIIIQKFKILSMPKLESLLLQKLRDANITRFLKYEIIDIFIESKLDVLDDDLIYSLIKENLKALDILSITLEYISYFNKAGFNDILIKYFLLDFPTSIKRQLLEILYRNNSFHIDELIKAIENDKNKDVLREYTGLLEENIVYEESGITIVQTMFYGDPEESGMGKSGGLGTLLKSLGNTLALEKDISRIITLSVNSNINRKIITKPLYKHWIIRLPIYINEDNIHEFLLKRNYIKRSIKSFLNLLNITPDIFHIRYLDDASKAVANLSFDLGSKLVFTVTPDPHRNMTDENNSLKIYPLMELMLNLNKIKIGDELIEMANGIIGIGRENVEEELVEYFPQLKEKNSIFKMIGEGINLNIFPDKLDLKRILTSDRLKHCIDEIMIKRPVILNVGRISYQKGQDKLLNAWGKSRLSQDYNLVIIGGSLNKPTPDEQRIMNYFDKFISENPDLKGKFTHIYSLSNDVIRNIEKAIIVNTQNSGIKYPPIYICSSIKEEFGISILEAMYEGFLTFAPIKGGAKTYIKNGFNGYLIDTSSPDKISEEVEKVIYYSSNTEEGYRKIRKMGKNTVKDNFSIQKISKDFLAFYKNILEEGIE
jgi:L-malate glycosyltransferase